MLKETTRIFAACLNSSCEYLGSGILQRSSACVQGEETHEYF